MSHCPNCGAEFGEAAKFCSGCGASQEPAKKVENHLVKSIIAALCCCMPFGIAGIVYAVKVDALLKRGDYAAAEDASRKADLWGNLAIGLGVLMNVFAALFSVFAGDRFSELRGF